jgi:hypothetical protein
MTTFQALNKNNMDSAKIFAENAIRNKKEAINLKRFGVKMGALAAKIESAYRTQQISETISKSVPMLQRCMKQMDTLGVRFSYLTSFNRSVLTSLNSSKSSNLLMLRLKN